MPPYHKAAIPLNGIAENNNGSKVNPGVYYIRLTAGDKVFVKTIVLIEN